MADVLLTEEELLLRRTVAEFADRELAPVASGIDERQEFPWTAVKGMAALGLYGIWVDPDYGGSGGGSKQSAVAVEEIARVCAATSVIYIAHHSLAMQTIHRFGSDEQKRRFLPPMVAGERLGAFCLSEPATGSDAAGIQTTATRSTDGYVLNGSKNFITNGSVADTLVVFATTDREKRHRGVNAFVVDRGAVGVSAQRMPGKMGLRASDTAMIYFDGVEVSDADRLGEEDQGFRIAMYVLDASRIGVAAQAVGIAQGALDAAARYATERQAFGKPIAELQAIQFMIADMATRTSAARLLTHYAAVRKDNGQPFTGEAAQAKLFASETATFCADRALQVHGGYGYFQPALVERAYRDAKVTEIYEGTSEIQRLVIARQVLQATGR